MSKFDFAVPTYPGFPDHSGVVRFSTEVKIMGREFNVVVLATVKLVDLIPAIDYVARGLEFSDRPFMWSDGHSQANLLLGQPLMAYIVRGDDLSCPETQRAHLPIGSFESMISKPEFVWHPECLTDLGQVELSSSLLAYFIMSSSSHQVDDKNGILQRTNLES
jgi:hypothetical protein